MASSTSERMAAMDEQGVGSGSGFAPHLVHCPHAAKNSEYLRGVNEDEDGGVLKGWLEGACSECGHEEENWVCLACHKVFCGRFANRHMVLHSQATGHCVVMGVADLSFWCYECDSYVSHLTHEVVYKLYNQLHKAKFGEPCPEPFQGRASDDPSPSADPAGSSSSSSAAAAAAPSAASTTSSCKVEGLADEVAAKPEVNAILGCIYGNALGDALGLATEFLDRAEVDRLYPDGQAVPFPNYKRNFHNSRWKAGDWTDDTDQMILIMQTLTETGGKLDEKLFAAKLRRWAYQGFPELGDMGGMGLGATVGGAIRHPRYSENPHAAAEDVWRRSGCRGAANGAVMRTSVLGCWQYDDLEAVMRNTELIARTTHWDPRCIASCTAVTGLISRLIQGEPCSTPEQIEALVAKSEQDALASVDLGEHKDTFLEHLHQKDLAALKLDERRAIGYTLKCFACGFWALRSTDDFKTTMNALIREAGDADTNGAVAGAVLGAKIGYNNLPADWLAAMPDKKWLDATVVKFLKLMKLA